MGEITLLLHRVAGGEHAAGERLYALLYPELKRLARSHLARAGSLTLDPTAIINEAWIRTEGQAVSANRGQFFAHASVVMRSVIIDHVREQRAEKRGSGQHPVTLSTAQWESIASPPDMLCLDDAMQLLRQVDERAHHVVEMRFFGGMTLEEIADVIGVSVPTLKRDWRRARAFLFEQLGTP